MSLRSDTIYITGLDSSIGEREIQAEIFPKPDFTITSVTVHHDKVGKSIGTAVVSFSSQEQALAAQKDFDGAMVDCHQIHVQLVGVTVQPRVITKAPAVTDKKVISKPIINNNNNNKETIADRRDIRDERDDFHGYRDSYRDPRDTRDPRDLRDTRNARDTRNVRDFHNSRDERRDFRGTNPTAASKPQFRQAQTHQPSKPISKAKPAPKQKVILSEQELDAQMDKYNAQRISEAE